MKMEPLVHSFQTELCLESYLNNNIIWTLVEALLLWEMVLKTGFEIFVVYVFTFSKKVF